MYRAAGMRFVFVYERTAQTAVATRLFTKTADCGLRLRLRRRRGRPRWIIASATDAVSPVHVAPQSSEAPFVFTHSANVCAYTLYCIRGVCVRNQMIYDVHVCGIISLSPQLRRSSSCHYYYYYHRCTVIKLLSSSYRYYYHRRRRRHCRIAVA